MPTKTINTRIQNKHDTEANWNKIHTTFIPLAGEIIIYDPDNTYEKPRFKIGDGSSTLQSLEFADSYSDIQEHITDTNNPHNVTKEQIGLGNVPNVNCQNAGNITSGYLNANRLISDPGAYYINPKLASSSYVLGELGAPCAFEAAVVESSLANQLRFFPIENLKFEVLTAEATEWADVTDSISEDTKKEFVNGLSNTYLDSITLSKGIQGYRIIIEPKEYTILSALYLFISTQGHQCKIKIESQIGNIEEWIVEQESSNAFNTWPGHVWFQHGNIPFNPSPYEGAQHRTKLRVTLTPVWGNNTQDILLYHINWYGGYPPSTSRYIYTWDKNKVVYFPGDIRSRDGYLYSTKDSRNIILQPLKLVRDNNIEINWPSKAGTFALTDDITSAMTNIKIDDGEL